MGLTEKRVIQKVKEQFIPDFRGRIEADCGFSVELDLDWESFGENAAHLEASESAFFCALSALKDICRDDLGRDLASKSVKKIVVHNAGESGDSACTFADGTVQLTLPRGGAASIGYSPRVAQAIGDGL